MQPGPGIVEEAFNSGDDNAEAAAKARNAARDSMMLQARLHRVESTARGEITLRIRNLSSGGLMADCTEPLTAGEQVVLDVRGIGEITGRVAWSHDGHIGVAFDTPIDPRQARKTVVVPKRPGAPVVKSRRPGLKIS
jgi:hypothetical protein